MMVFVPVISLLKVQFPASAAYGLHLGCMSMAASNTPTPTHPPTLTHTAYRKEYIENAETVFIVKSQSEYITATWHQDKPMAASG